MALITRTAKGSKLTIQEMDGNLTYLASSSFQDGVYSQTVIGTGAVISIAEGSAVSGSEGVYEDVSPTGGSGTGLVVNIRVQDLGKGLGAEFIIVNGGTGYENNENITVQNTDIGGVSGTTNFVIFEVNSTKTSTITVTEDEIALSTTDISITGSIQQNGNFTCDSSILAGSVLTSAASARQLTVSNPKATPQNPTIINFTGLPTTDPSVAGWLWNDSGSLKISAG